jgi:HlyD family secretion protein
MTGGAKRPCAMPPPLPSPEQWVAITLSAAKAAIGNRRTVVWSRARPTGGVQPPRAPATRHRKLPTSAVWSAMAALEPKSRGRDRFDHALRAARQVMPRSALPLSVRLRSFVEGAWSKPISPPTENAPVHQGLERALARELHRGRRVLTIAAVLLVGWAGLVPLSGAVVVAGRLVVQSSIKKIQHPQGGIVASINVRNGSKVYAGDELVRLDETAARSNLQVVSRQLDEARLRIARLRAERDNVATPRWPTEWVAQLDAAERDQLLASEDDLFAARAGTRRSQQELAASRITQLEKQIAGLEAQQKSNGKQMGITGGELKGVEELLRQKLVTLPRATALQREAAHLDGVEGQLASQIAETRAKVSEARLQALQAEQTFQSELLRDLREAEAKEGELMERRLAAEDQMNRTTIRAPTSGTVQELAVHTIGGVVGPAEVLMTVVPESDTLAVEARLSADKVDQVHNGQSARVRLSALNQRTTPELAGVVTLVSADIVRDPQSSTAYYDVRIDLPPEEVGRLGTLQLVPGMPAEIFLITQSRTMLSYLVKPMTDQLARMFRER